MDANTIAENVSNGATVGITASAGDADGSDTVSYTLSNDAGGRFAIDGGTGVVTLADASQLDYEAATSHGIEVTATSTDDSTSTQAYTIALTDDPSDNLNVIDGNTSSDTLDGTAGNDLISGYGGSDTLNGNDGDDTLDGGEDSDTLNGGAGNDTLLGGSGTGSDTLYGDDGNDALSGGAGGDVLYGGSDDDTLDGGAGNDDLYGEDGNDILVWDAANSKMEGGAGTDTLRVDSGDVDLTNFGGTIQGIEIFNLEADAGANSLTLTMSDVVNVSDTDVLTVDGDAGDSIDAGTGWTDGGVDGGYHIYTQGLATLNVDIEMTVNADIV